MNSLTELAPLLVALGRAEIELALHPTDSERLRYRLPIPDGWATELPPDLSARLRLHRAAVLKLLANGGAEVSAGATDAGYVRDERLGIADDLGLPTHPGSPAWLVAMGELLGHGCLEATLGVYSGHGTTDQCGCSRGEGERSNPLCDRQGGACGA